MTTAQQKENPRMEESRLETENSRVNGDPSEVGSNGAWKKRITISLSAENRI
jgi:hypothetical protein